MTKRQLRKAARIHVSNGLSKQETYDILKSENKISSDDLGRIVQTIASLNARIKFKIMNGNLMLIIVFTIILKILTLIWNYSDGESNWFQGISLLMSILFLIGVARYYKGTYVAIMVIYSIGLVGVILSFDYNFEAYEIVNLAIFIALILLSYLLNKKLFPNFTKEKQLYRNRFNQDRMRYLIKFED
ncbi:hypothetical protein [Brumimicrobium mesophilum]|uniref:hypothetical protein n=1 Tax=Brumimicrobium mesophilum TaxID=392717 RepID=UPI000D141DE4|nr:hypothetical protein [Brumimicrobium mesophilum]